MILQTYKPEDPVIGYASRQDYRAFFESEFRRRRNSLYPPFTNLARILTESVKEEDAERKAAMVEKAVREMLETHPEWQRKVVSVLNEVPSVKFLRGKHRRHLLMKTLVSAETDAFFGALTDMLDETEDSCAEAWLEINPTTMI